MIRVLVVVMLSGCSAIFVRGPASKGPKCTSTMGPAIIDTMMVVGTTSMAVPLLIYGARNHNCDPRQGPCLADAALYVGVVAGVQAIVYVLSAAHGYSSSEACRAYKRQAFEDQISRDEKARTHDRAWGLTKTAADAARAGDCDQVRMIDRNVQNLDAEFHRTVFARDAAITRCLEPPTPTTTMEPPPP